MQGNLQESILFPDELTDRIENLIVELKDTNAKNLKLDMQIKPAV